MNGSMVFLVAFFTSVLTSVGAVYLVERLQIFEQPQAEPQQAVVPSLTGQAEKDAMGNLQALGLSLFVVGRESDKDAKPGTIVRQSTAPGQKVAPGTVVNVVLAEAVHEVPDLIGKAREEAEEALKKSGFNVSYGEPLAHAEIPEGKIAAQSPKAGASLKPGEEVELRPSAGPAEVDIPKVTGFSLSHAKKTLESAGLKHMVRWVDLPETASYVVLRQIPDAGGKAKPNDQITLVINRD